MNFLEFQIHGDTTLNGNYFGATIWSGKIVPSLPVLFTTYIFPHHMNVCRYVLTDDLAKWLTIDEKTGAVKSVKQMDRESPYVHNSVYTVKVLAIDDGKLTKLNVLHKILLPAYDLQ